MALEMGFLAKATEFFFRLGVEKFLDKDNVVSGQSCFYVREAWLGVYTLFGKFWNIVLVEGLSGRKEKEMGLRGLGSLLI
jgi:hypothetical protein